jgi:hypothetical protein
VDEKQGYVGEQDRVINVINLSGFDSSLGREMNDSIIKSFPSSIEISLSQEHGIQMKGLKTSPKVKFENEMGKWESCAFGNRSKDMSDRKALLNVMYHQMLLMQDNVLKIPFSNSRFYLQTESKERVNFGVELLFMHSLVHISRESSSGEPRMNKLGNASMRKVEGDFGFVVNFDSEHVFILSPFNLDPVKEDMFEIIKSPDLCLELNQELMMRLDPSLKENKTVEIDLPFKNLQLSKKISTKLRKKISKRKNIS